MEKPIKYFVDHGDGGSHSIFDGLTFPTGCQQNNNGWHKYVFSNGVVLCEYCGRFPVPASTVTVTN